MKLKNVARHQLHLKASELRGNPIAYSITPPLNGMRDNLRVKASCPPVSASCGEYSSRLSGMQAFSLMCRNHNQRSGKRQKSGNYVGSIWKNKISG